MLPMRTDIITRMANVQVRDVPDDVHRKLKAKAALRGQSLNDFLLQRISEIARLPTVAELAERISQREPYTGPSSAAVIRDDRDRR